MKWQTMETAPRNGEMFLINDDGDIYPAYYWHSTGRNGRVFELHFIDNVKNWDADGDLQVNEYVIKPNAFDKNSESKVLWAPMTIDA